MPLRSFRYFIDLNECSSFLRVPYCCKMSISAHITTTSSPPVPSPLSTVMPTTPCVSTCNLACRFWRRELREMSYLFARSERGQR
eukprot:5626155-Prymnesium_polylepis.1